MKIQWFRKAYFLLLIIMPICLSANFIDDNFDSELWGFYEMRIGTRLHNDPNERQFSVAEARVHTEGAAYSEKADFKLSADVLGDDVLHKFDLALREVNVFVRPSRNIDVKVGRQILTTGTGDLLFINDLYPKDWQSFFIGRDDVYLKAPSDALKMSFFADIFDCDVVYIPKFNSDRYISGERLSYWNNSLSHLAGRNDVIEVDKRNSWFEDYETSIRLYKNIDNYEVSLYGYRGYWKTPGGQNSSGVYYFPRLNVYGGSIRGKVSQGIANMELGYYDSVDNRNGLKGGLNNSELRYLIGYTQEIGHNFTAGVQFYLEQMLKYSEYKKHVQSYRRDHYRSLVTLRLTKLLMNQNLTCSLFVFGSFTDKDIYLRPRIEYKATDYWRLEAGGNAFVGKNAYTFFGQFRENSNAYISIRRGF